MNLLFSVSKSRGLNSFSGADFEKSASGNAYLKHEFSSIT